LFPFLHGGYTKPSQLGTKRMTKKTAITIAE
jgi:hypothetical protein